MSTIRSARAVLIPALFSVLVPLAAHAQEIQLFTWSGRVDREVRIDATAGGVRNTTESSLQSHARFNVTSPLPERPGILHVAVNRGRGTVDVIQQPTRENGYTAAIRIVDHEGGADDYRVTAFWTPTDEGRGDRGRGNGRGNEIIDRGRDNRDDRMSRDAVPMLQWSGDVDGEIQLVWRNGAVRVQQGGGAPPQRIRSTVSGPVRDQLPGQITLSVHEGRGRVEVIQQPGPRNGYTGIIRISDPQPSFGHYTFDATWR